MSGDPGIPACRSDLSALAEPQPTSSAIAAAITASGIVLTIDQIAAGINQQTKDYRC